MPVARRIKAFLANSDRNLIQNGQRSLRQQAEVIRAESQASLSEAGLRFNIVLISLPAIYVFRVSDGFAEEIRRGKTAGHSVKLRRRLPGAAAFCLSRQSSLSSL